MNGNKFGEAWFHHQLKEYHYKNEWFYEVDIEKYINLYHTCFNENNVYKIPNNIEDVPKLILEKIIKVYFDTEDKKFLNLLPNLPDYKKYLRIDEIINLKYDIQSLDKKVETKKKILECFIEVYRSEFITQEELLTLLENEFNKRGILIKPKIALLEKCPYYKIKRCTRKIENEIKRGCIFGEPNWEVAPEICYI